MKIRLPTVGRRSCGPGEGGQLEEEEEEEEEEEDDDDEVESFATKQIRPSSETCRAQALRNMPSSSLDNRSQITIL